MASLYTDRDLLIPTLSDDEAFGDGFTRCQFYPVALFSGNDESLAEFEALRLASKRRR